MAHTRLSKFLENYNLLNPRQFGFRVDHSTAHPLTLVIDKLAKAIDDKKHSIAIFCDLSKAFDCVDHPLLLKKLSRFGVGGSAVSWFSSYLNHRQQMVSVGDSGSSYGFIRLGVPQGSILGHYDKTYNVKTYNDKTYNDKTYKDKTYTRQNV